MHSPMEGKHLGLHSPGPGGGGTPNMKGVGVLVVSLRGVTFGFWSHLGCSGQNAIIFSREGPTYGCTRKKINIYVVVQFYTWFKFSFLWFLGMVMYDNNMIMSLKQKKRKFEPRIKLNHNIYTLLFSTCMSYNRKQLKIRTIMILYR